MTSAPYFAAPQKKDEPPTHDVLIIHHISNLQHSNVRDEQAPLMDYKLMVRNLPPEEQPDILIVSGNLTLTGSESELREVRTMLGDILAHQNKQHVFVIPGPHDINWASVVGNDHFKTFYNTMNPMATVPLFVDRNGTSQWGSSPYVYSSAEKYLIYTANSCYPHDPSARAARNQPPLPYTRYNTLWNKYHAGTATTFDKTQRDDLIRDAARLGDHGLIVPQITTSFVEDIEQLALDDDIQKAKRAGLVPIVPLKILVTHHPLIGHVGRNAISIYPAENSGGLLSAARNASFHMALYGNANEAHAQADLPIDATGTGVPMMHIGAGALGNPFGLQTYNHLTARRDRATGAWMLDLRVVKIDSPIANYRPMTFMIGQPMKAVTTQSNDQQTTKASVLKDFNERIQFTFAIFNEDLATSTNRDVPMRALDSIKDIIREVVFKGFDIRMGLALKQRFSTDGSQNAATVSGNKVLVNRYIEPGHLAAGDSYIYPFSYPDTIAAWALVQGQMIRYPNDIMGDAAKPIDYNWLQTSNKQISIAQILDEAGNRGNVPNASQVQLATAGRARMLHSKLINRQLTLLDIFMPAQNMPVSEGFSSRFTSFISVPVPLRPSAANFSRSTPEIGTLNVDVIDVPPSEKGSAFTEERMEMLHTLSDMITTILLTAHKLGRPLGHFEG